MTCLNAFEVQIWNSETSWTKRTSNQNIVMNEKLVKKIVMNAKIYPKVVMDLSIFSLDEWCPYSQLVDGTFCSPATQHDWKKLWMRINCGG